MYFKSMNIFKYDIFNNRKFKNIIIFIQNIIDIINIIMNDKSNNLTILVLIDLLLKLLPMITAVISLHKSIEEDLSEYVNIIMNIASHSNYQYKFIAQIKEYLKKIIYMNDTIKYNLLCICHKIKYNTSSYIINSISCVEKIHPNIIDNINNQYHPRCIGIIKALRFSLKNIAG